MYKWLLVICMFFIAAHADDFTLDHLQKFKRKYGWSEERIMRAIKGKHIQLDDETYFELEKLGFSEKFIDHIMMMGKKKSTMPQRILQHYRKRNNSPQIFALIIGINSYQAKEKLPYLHTPRTDAEELAKTLLSIGVVPENIDLIIDGEATKQHIAKTIAKCKKKQGTFYFFFSGHGLSVDGDFYFACYDTTPSDVTKTAYAIETMKSDIQNMQANHAIILLDACHSGASKNARFNTKRKKHDGQQESIVTLGADEKGNKKMRDLEGVEKPIFLMSSCGANEYSWQGAKNSHFTHFLLEALQGKADNDKNNVVDTLELSEYVRKNVIRQTQGQQKPDFTQSRGWEWKHHSSAGIKVFNNKWYEWQINMQKQFDARIAYEKKKVSYAKKLYFWKQFYSKFTNETNPDSKEDEELLAKAQKRIYYWQEKLKNLMKLEITPANPKCKVNQMIQFTVAGIRGNGERYTPSVVWKAKGGSIDSRGLFTASSREGTAKIMAQSTENKSIRKIVSIAITKDRIARLEIQPSSVELFSGETAKFTFAGYDENGKKLNSLNNVSLTITGGKLNTENVYVAGEKPGVYELRIDHENVNAIAQITIKLKVKDTWAEIVNDEKFESVNDNSWDNIEKNDELENVDKNSITFDSFKPQVGNKIDDKQSYKMKISISVFSGRKLQDINVSQLISQITTKEIIKTQPFKKARLYIQEDRTSQQVGNGIPQVTKSPLEGKFYISTTLGEAGNFFTSPLNIKLTVEETLALNKKFSGNESDDLDNYFTNKTYQVGQKISVPEKVAMKFFGNAEMDDFSFILKEVVYISQKKQKQAIFDVKLKGIGKIPDFPQGKMHLDLSGKYIINQDGQYHQMNLQGPVQVEGEQIHKDQFENAVKMKVKGQGQIEVYALQMVR